MENPLPNHLLRVLAHQLPISLLRFIFPLYHFILILEFPLLIIHIHSLHEMSVPQKQGSLTLYIKLPRAGAMLGRQNF